MPATALLLVLLSAASHASWNLAVKGSREKYAFTWWMMAAGCVLTLPAVFLLPVRFTPFSVALLVISSAAEAVYLLTLSASYHRLPYTVAYPVARGSAPVFIALAAALVLRERISLVGLGGILLVSLGILSLHGRAEPGSSRWLLAIPLGCGACIACFSVTDKAAVQYFSPLALASMVFGGSALFFWPYVAFVRRVSLLDEFRHHWLRALLVAFFCLFGYALVLAAMRIAPVSYVGAARESSVLFAAILGWLILREGFGPRRLFSAAVIFAGIVCLTLAR